jgi:hypothetical protein
MGYWKYITTGKVVEYVVYHSGIFLERLKKKITENLVNIDDIQREIFNENISNSKQGC